MVFIVSVILTGSVRYSDPATVARVNQLIQDLESSHYINPHLTKSWLRQVCFDRLCVKIITDAYGFWKH